MLPSPKRARSGGFEFRFFSLRFCRPFVLPCPSNDLLVDQAIDRVDPVDNFRNLSIALKFLQHDRSSLARLRLESMLECSGMPVALFGIHPYPPP